MYSAEPHTFILLFSEVTVIPFSPPHHLTPKENAGKCELDMYLEV